MRWSRLLSFAGILVVSGGVAATVAALSRYHGPHGGLPRPLDNRFEAAFREELEHAGQLGMTEERPGEGGSVELQAGAYERGHWEREVELAHGECLAFVAGMTGCLGLVELRIQERGQSDPIVFTTVSGVSEHFGQVHWCAWGAPLQLEVSADAMNDLECKADFEGNGTLRWQIRRGPADAIDGPASLPAIDQVNDQNVEVAERAAAECWCKAHRDPDSALGEPARASFDEGAVLLPPSPATCHAVYALANRDAASPVHPRLAAPGTESCPPEGVHVDAVHDAVRTVGGRGGHDRILAVVDRGALGAPCVRVRLARLHRGYRAPAVRVVDIEGELSSAGEMLPRVPEAEEIAFVDEACPARGLVAYVVRDDDQEDYRIDVVRAPAPPNTVAHAASRPSGPLPVAQGAATDVAAQAAACERGAAADGCLDAAMAYRDARGVEQDFARAAELFRRACDAGSADGCAYLAHAYDRGEGLTEDREEARRRYQTACQQGSALGCAYMGDAERMTPDAPVESMHRAAGYYETACRGHVSTACEDRHLLDELDLM